MENSRRSFIKKAGIAAAGGLILGNTLSAKSHPNNLRNHDRELKRDGNFLLPSLPYSFDALEPVIDAQTMNIHWDKHHRTYVTKLNEALEKTPEYKTKTLEALIGMIGLLPDSIKTAVRNQGGGHWNHSFFWNILSATKNQSPGTETRYAIEAKWGTLDAFKATFQDEGLKVFGSGWVWLIKNQAGEISITTTSNQDNPLMDIAVVKGIPLMGIDVWEHAYYLKHQNMRATYLKEIWSVINWEKVESLFNS